MADRRWIDRRSPIADRRPPIAVGPIADRGRAIIAVMRHLTRHVTAVGTRDGRVGRPRRHGSARRRRAPAAARLHGDDAAERPEGDPLRGPLDADRAPAALVSRRIEGRAQGTDRLRAPVRAHDVQGVEERGPRAARVDDRERGRPLQRVHDRGRDGVLGHRALALPAPGPVARGGPHGDAAHRRAGLQERAPGRQGRAPDAGGEPAVRPVDGGHLRHGVHGAPVQAPGHRQHGGSRGGIGRGRARLLSHVLRAGERDADARRRFRHAAGARAGDEVLRRGAQDRPSDRP